jgi:amino acid adenylation domain-containing protein
MVHVARLRAERDGGRPAYTFLDKGEREAGTLTFAALDRRARAIAAGLVSRRREQPRALMLYASGLEFIEAFWACLYARVIAVPAYPPRSHLHGSSRLEAIVKDCAPSLILSTRDHLADLAAMAPGALKNARAVATDEIPDSDADAWRTMAVRPDDVAMLQYSSGSTSTPKGVIVSHGNILANQRMIQAAFEHTEASTFVGWLPFFHDMGLFGNIIQPLFIGAHSFLMSPASFVQKPVRWLRAISTYRAHTSGGPNFGFDYCSRRITDEEKDGLDLATWRTAFNGSEKPRADTMARFVRAFGASGFRAQAFYPCYGLAEAVLFVTGRNRAAQPEIVEARPAVAPAGAAASASPAVTTPTVSSGHGWPGQRLLIVDPQSRRALSDGHVGEVWIQGPHIALGYWRQTDVTEAVFSARLAAEDGSVSDGASNSAFLRTGDLGFIRDGELFVTGRLKDLVILRGQNYHPEDIEAVVHACDDGAEAGQSAAFAVDAGDDGDASGERLVILIEVGKGVTEPAALRALCDRASDALSLAFEIAVGEIVLVRKGTIPKTSSGKVQRFLCRERFLANELDPIARVVYAGAERDEREVEAWECELRAALAVAHGDARLALIRDGLERAITRLLPALRPPRDGTGDTNGGGASAAAPSAFRRDATLIAHGLDSVRVVQLQQTIVRACAAEVSIAELFEAGSIDALAALVHERSRVAAAGARMPDASSEAGSAPRHEGAAPAIDPAIAPVHDRARDGALSYGQRALYAEYEQAPTGTASHITAALHLTGGRIEAARFERAWQRLLDRHPQLAATFVTVDGEAVQRRADRDALRLVSIDLSSARAEPGEWTRRIQAEADRPFLLHDAAVRCRLFLLDDDRAVLLIVLHHIVVDLASLELLLHDFAALYAEEEAPAAFAAERSRRSAPATDYASFVAWEDAYVRSARGAASLEFWRAHLAGSHANRLPGSRPSAGGSRRSGRLHEIQFDRDEAAAIRRCAAREGVTPYALLLAAYAALLGTMCRDDRVLIGVSVDGRPDERFARVAGYFANIVPLQLAVEPAASPRTLSARANALVRRALDHRHYPLSQLVARIGGGDRAERAPDVRYAFTLGQARHGEAWLGLLAHGEPLSFGSLLATAFPHDRGMAPFDLTLMLLERAGALSGCFCYAADVLDAGAVASLAAAYRETVTAFVRRPETPIGRVSYRAGAPALETSDPAADAAGPSPSSHPLVIQRFAEQARISRDAIALREPDGQFTYHAVARRARAIAGRLEALGAGPETIVAVHCPRGAQLVIGILGVAMTGAAYLPIDIETPPERVSWLLRDARAQVLVTDSAQTAAAAPAGTAVRTLILDEPDSDAVDPPPSRPMPRRFDDDLAERLAYVIYTSGSTGQPKGVGVTHHNVARLFDSAGPFFGFRSSDVWTLAHSIAFDFSVWEMWGALTTGGSLVILSRDDTRDPRRLQDVVLREQVTVLNQTPSAFYNLLASLGASAVETIPLSLRFVILGGEALKHHQIASWFTQPCSDQAELVNMYGITETTVHVTWSRVDARHAGAAAVRGGGSAIGRGLPDLRIEILNRSRQRLPAYGLGEIGVSGAGLARGYLGQPAQTAGRFIPDPFSGVPGARLYLTGDLAYRRADDDVVYVGRADRQVKIRGHRIEPGEIEAALRGCAGVEWALVIAEEGPGGDARLTAYVNGAAGLTVAALREHLLRGLPAPMVPATFLRAGSVPTTEQGKVDIRALQAVAEPLARGQGIVLPRSDAEAALAAIWADVLQAPAVGIDDNYFELGGDSIRSIQIVARTKAIGVPIDLPRLYAAQTIRRLLEPAPGSVDGQSADNVTASDDAVAWAEPFALVAPHDRARLPEGLEDAHPVDALLQGLLFHSEFSDDYEIYVTSFHVRAPWNPEAFADAIAACLDEHPFLRSSIETGGYSEPLQLVHAHAGMTPALHDIQALGPEAQDEEIRAYIEAERSRPFDWRQPPLLRWAIHRRGPDTFQATLSEPYLDGWCVATLFARMFERYLAAVRGDTVPVRAPGAIRQRHFVQLERQALDDAGQRAFWSRFLAGAADSRLARVFHAPSNPARWHDRRTIALPADLTARLAALAARASVPLRTVFVATHALVLSRVLEEPTPVFGIVLNGRPEEAGGDTVIGSFLNTVPMRLAVDPRGPWTECLARVFEIEREIWPHRRFPFSAIKKVSGEMRFDTVFNFTDFHALSALRGREDFEILDASASEQTFFPLTVHVNRSVTTGRFELLLDYNCRELSSGVVERLAQSYLAALDSIAAAGEDADGVRRAAAAIDRQMQPAAPPPAAPCALVGSAGEPTSAPVLTAIDRICDRAPDAIAVVDGDRAVTYAALRAAAVAAACHLREAHGVGREDLVALQVPQGLDFVRGVLAILAAGAVYVPIDIDCPPERTAAILSACRIKALITGSRPGPAIASSGVPLVSLDTVPRGSVNGSRLAGRAPFADQLAYVMHTSGSTGAPKGVGVTHAGLAALAAAAIDTYAIASADRVLQFATPVFDIAVEEIFMTLSAGATLIVRPPDLLDNFDVFHQWCVREAITCLDLPTAFWHAWMRELPAASLRSRGALRLVIIGGEAMDADAAAAWLAMAPEGPALINTYGPTETTVTAAAARVGAPPAPGPEAASPGSPIGTSFGAAHLAPLDRHWRTVPPGIPGELSIGGVVVARGYYAQPRATAERFTPDPDSAYAPGARRYRTGDLVLQDDRGRFYFAGRLDRQVKIRGHRVELEEVEAALRACAGVRDAAATIAARDGGRSLVAAVVLDQRWDGDRLAQTAAIRDQLASMLPAYMVPAVITAMDALPRTTSGKVRYAALHPGPSSPGADAPDTLPAASRLPRTSGALPDDDLTRTIAAICSAGLGRDIRTLDADFFALGGDSLTAMRVASRLRAALDCDVSVRDLFEQPRLGALSALLRQRIAHRRNNDAPRAPGWSETGTPAADRHTLVTPEEPSAQADDVLSFAQERLWMAEHLAPGATSYSIPAAIVITGAFNAFAFEQSLRDVQRRHHVLRTRIVLTADGPRPRVDAIGRIAISRIDLSALPAAVRDARLQQWRNAHARARFDLDRDPPLRVAVFTVSPREHHLSIAIHHIVADGWSIELLTRELLDGYADYARGVPSHLPAPAIQYADYARRQKAVLQGTRRHQLLDYWERRLAGMPDHVELPLDYARPPVNRFEGARHDFTIDRELRHAVDALAAEAGATRFMVLLAVYALLLQRRSGQTDLIVGTPVSMRETPEAEALIGLFLNQLVLRLDLSGRPSCREVIARVRREVLAAYDHRDLPFELLVSHLRPPRDTALPPIVQTVFACWPRPWQNFSMPGAAALMFPAVHNGAAKYDLEVQIVDAGDEGLHGYFEYNTALFHGRTIRDLAADYQAFLRAVVMDPSRRADALEPRWPAAERAAHLA